MAIDEDGEEVLLEDLFVEGFSVEYMLASEPSFEHVPELDPDSFDEEDLYYGDRVIWAAPQSRHILAIESDHIIAMMGNMWGPAHLAGLYAAIESGNRPVFEVPAARIYRIDQSDLEEQERELQRLLDDGMDPEEGMSQWLQEAGLQRLWTEADLGAYTAQLLDGNHRAFAAVLAGEDKVYVTIGENYREDVDPDDWA